MQQEAAHSLVWTHNAPNSHYLSLSQCLGGKYHEDYDKYYPNSSTGYYNLKNDSVSKALI